MVVMRSSLTIAVLCLAAAVFHPRELAAQAMPSSDSQARIDEVCSCVLAKVIDRRSSS